MYSSEHSDASLGLDQLIVACIPAFNEEKTIARVVVVAQRFVDWVVVCDDGSNDLTANIAEKLGATVIRHEKNMGKGESLRSLFRFGRESKVDVLVTIDGDGQHDPNEIPLLIKPISDGLADIVVGNRFHEKSSDIPAHRQVGNKVLNLVTLEGISDTQSGFRAYNQKAFSQILPAEMGMGVDSEILMEAANLGLRITEVPISVRYDIGDTSTHNPFFHTLDVFMSVVKLTSIRHPLIFYGISGVVLIAVGIYFAVLALIRFSEKGVFTNLVLTYEFLGFGITFLGILTLFTGIILFTLSTVVRKG